MIPLIESICFGADGLVPVVVQDAETGEVLMLAWANRESLLETERLGEMVFYSRSRNELWHKGATSGNTLRIVEIRRDCDSDALLAIAKPTGPACHTGSFSCFSAHGEKTAGLATFPGKLWKYLRLRSNDSPDESYTARLIQEGLSRVSQKVGEEGVETALAAASGDRNAFVSEAADLFYHLLVCCVALEVEPAAVWAELEERHRGKTRI
ncbi:MAG: bifunctional phosphoribosyl-AMP cyclohydrolase/phosphoribosyl-ATP diphosphatase HisIE [Thermovirgaceae bacterium]|nr:bifunctional phosphoribosyl-AMP cyclohydrolase/phosphoribosyl-ATP diphosphatase HisIE [Thermovirgaceae bacterium]